MVDGKVLSYIIFYEPIAPLQLQFQLFVNMYRYKGYCNCPLIRCLSHVRKVKIYVRGLYRYFRNDHEKERYVDKY